MVRSVLGRLKSSIIIEVDTKRCGDEERWRGSGKSGQSNALAAAFPNAESPI
jgi:hypothetical protein